MNSDLTGASFRLGFWRNAFKEGQVYVSPELWDIYGLSPLSGPFDVAVIDALFEEEAQFRAIRMLVRDGKDAPLAEFWIRRPDGARRCLRIACGHERNAAGEVFATYGAVADITDIAIAANEAAAKEQLLSSFIEHAPAALAMFDTEMRYLRVSPRWMTDYGLGGEEIFGRSHYEIFPEIGEQWKAIHQRCLAGAVERCERDLFVREDGRRQWISWEVRPWRTPAGIIGGLLMLTRDITALVASIEALELSERRLNLALELGGMLVWQRDRRTGALAIRGATTELLGRDPFDQVSWDEIWALVHDDDREAMTAAFHEAVANKQVLKYEHRLTHQAGDEIWGASVIDPLFDDDGVHIGAVGLLKNITGRKVQERTLAAAREAAEAASQAKSQFLATMSHEIRTPLNGVMGVAQALARTGLDPRQQEMVELILQAGRTLKSLVDDALDIGRIESDALALDVAPLVVGDVVRSAVMLFEPEARQKGLAFTYTDASASAMHALGDAVRLRQIVSNLVGNAVKFTDRGRIDVVVSCGRETSGAIGIQVSVTDTGAGVDAGLREKMFERFVQGDLAAKAAAGGAGLGLAIATALAKAMNGALVFEPNPGGGSVFTFSCALQGAPVAEGASDASLCSAEAQGQATIEILVAEDSPLNQKIIALLLEPYAARLSFVGDGAEACAAVTRKAYDLVLMDMRMPVMDGLSAIKVIRGLEVAKNATRLPIICLTAQAAPGQVEAAMTAGADAYVSKPIELGQLVQAIDQALGEWSPRSAA